MTEVSLVESDGLENSLVELDGLANNIVELDGLETYQNQTIDRDYELFKHELKLTISFWVNGVIIPVICIFGIIGNILCVFVFNKKDVELKPSFANLLKCLSIYDIIFLVCVLFIYCGPHLSTTYYTLYAPYLDPYIFPFTHIALTGSVYTTIGVAVERFITVCYPFTRCQMSNGLGYIIPIVLFSVLYNLVKFFETETGFIPHEEWLVLENGTNMSTTVFKPVINATLFRRNPTYMLVMITIVNNIVMGLLPILLLSVLNFLIYNSIAKATAAHNNISSSHRRDNTMARLLMAIVFVFLSCHTIKFCLNIFEAYEMVVLGELSSPFWVLILVDVNHILLAINSAINIVIYSFKDFKFRNALVKSFRKKRSFPSFRTSGVSSFGSTRYRRGHHTSPKSANHLGVPHPRITEHSTDCNSSLLGDAGSSARHDSAMMGDGASSARHDMLGDGGNGVANYIVEDGVSRQGISNIIMEDGGASKHVAFDNPSTVNGDGPSRHVVVENHCSNNGGSKMNGDLSQIHISKDPGIRNGGVCNIEVTVV